MKTVYTFYRMIKNYIPLTWFLLPGGLPRGFFATLHSSTVGISFLFLSSILIIGDDKLILSMGVGVTDIVFCIGKTMPVGTTNKK